MTTRSDHDTRFDRDTRLERLDESTFAANIDKGWWIINGPNGGYVAAVILRALQDTVAEAARVPRSLTIHYLRPPGEGPATVKTKVERAGRSMSTITATLIQNDKPLALAIGAFGYPRKALGFVDGKMPSVPPPEECELMGGRLVEAIPMRQRYETRLVTKGGAFSGAERAEIGGWMRLEEPRLADALLVGALTDALPPPVFVKAQPDDGLGPIPTIDLTIHFRAALPIESAKPEDYCLAFFTTKTSRDGYVEEDGEIWSRDGLLLAQSRQLALLAGPVIGP